MKVHALDIERPTWGENSGKLVGCVTLKDDLLGEIKVPLTPAGISRLLASISTEVNSTVRQLALEVPKAIKHAEDEGYLLEQDGEIK